MPLPPVGRQDPGVPITLDADGGLVVRTITEHGTRVLTEAMPATRAVTIGVWVPVGSRDEDSTNAGASHFLEHMLFKGTGRRSAMEISATIDAVGGDLNAFTSKEYTCYYARVLDRDASLALDVLLDMVGESLLTGADVDSERDVVIEEIAMHEDDPSGVAQELFAGLVFAGSPLADPVIGTAAGIAGMPQEVLRAHYERWYHPHNIVVTAAGGLDHEAVVETVARGVDRWPSRSVAAVTRPGAREAAPGEGLPLVVPAQTMRHRHTEQVNLVTGFPGIPRGDERRYAFAVLNAALGGGMSSRLFQEVREKRGLAYSVGCVAPRYSDAGAFGVYAGASPARREEALSVIDEVLDDVRRNGLTDDELARGQGQARGGLVLAMEESSARMTALGDAELVTGRYVPVAEAIAGIDSVTAEQVAELASVLLSGPRVTSVVTPESEARADEENA